MYSSYCITYPWLTTNLGCLPRRYWSCKMLFPPTLEVLNWNLPNLFYFTELQKLWLFFLKPDVIPKLHLLKPSSVIYHGTNNTNSPGIFPTTFLQPVNGIKNSILNRVIKLWSSISSCFLFVCLFVFEKPLKEFRFRSHILLTLWFRYLQTHRNRREWE